MEHPQIVCRSCGLKYDWSVEFAGQICACECGEDLPFPPAIPPKSDARAMQKKADEPVKLEKVRIPEHSILAKVVEVESPLWKHVFYIVMVFMAFWAISALLYLGSEESRRSTREIIRGASGLILLLPSIALFRTRNRSKITLGPTRIETNLYGSIDWADIEEAKAIFMFVLRATGSYMVISLKPGSDSRRRTKARRSIFAFLHPKAAKVSGMRCDVLFYVASININALELAHAINERAEAA